MAPEADALELCAAHLGKSIAACGRCGVFFCEQCSGAAPNDTLCAACDRRCGAIAWESERAKLGTLRAWRRTVSDVSLTPSRTARRLPTEGSLRAPLTFAASMIALHAVGFILVYGSIIWWTTSYSLARFGAIDTIGRMVVFGGMVDKMLLGTLAPLILLATGPALLVAAARCVRIDVTARGAFGAVAYSTAGLLIGLVPFVGYVMYPWLAFFFAEWLAARADVPTWRRLCAIAIGASFAALVLMFASFAYQHTLAGVVRDFVEPFLFE